MEFKRPLPYKSQKQVFPNKFYSCAVCGDIAFIKNYGVMSCQACKIFFRRNGFHPKLVRPCPFDGQCEVNLLTRNACTSCRLAKCFSVGMKSDLIRKEELSCEKSNKNQIIKSETIVPITQLPTLNLLRDDKSLLTTNDWTLFSNVIHACDKFSLVPMLNDIKTNLTSSSSSSSNQIGFTSIDVMQIINRSYSFALSLIKCIPDYQVLTVGEQQSLLERNMHGTGGIYTNLIFRDSGFVYNPKCWEAFSRVYGSQEIERAGRFAQQLDDDSTLLKLMIIISAFSTNFFIVDIKKNMPRDSFQYGTYRLLGSQNIYVELLWKYMLYRYGYQQTVLRFTGLIICTLSILRNAANVYMNNAIHHDLVNEVAEKIEEKLIIDQTQTTPLWGKTDIPAVDQ